MITTQQNGGTYVIGYIAESGSMNRFQSIFDQMLNSIMIGSVSISSTENPSSVRNQDQNIQSSVNPMPSQPVETPVDADNHYFAKLSGDNEVPPVDSTHSGTAYFSIDGNSVSYSIKFSMGDIVGAHLHRGGPGTNGDVILDLLKNYEDGNKVSGSFTSADFSGPFEGRSIDDLIEEMNSGDIYVNLHTEEYMDGEIRGPVRSP